jgi:hypothetical protein
MVAISQIHPRPANFKDMAGSIFVGGDGTSQCATTKIQSFEVQNEGQPMQLLEVWKHVLWKGAMNI